MKIENKIRSIDTGYFNMNKPKFYPFHRPIINEQKLINGFISNQD